MEIKIIHNRTGETETCTSPEPFEVALQMHFGAHLTDGVHDYWLAYSDLIVAHHDGDVDPGPFSAFLKREYNVDAVGVGEGD